ncbi:MAG TPA: NADPH-dependent FMN reductase [Bacteroidia bacterium]|jgi:NAD(P)H-dependent FMN reductase
MKIAIISGSVRTGRQSHRVAEYFNNFISGNKLGEPEIIDLKEYNFPILEERLSKMPSPGSKEQMFSEKISSADIVIVVFPEYNGGYSASIKNAIDLLYYEWHHKPVGLVSVSSGAHSGVNALALLQSIFLKIKAVPAASFPVPVVQESFDENGNAINKEATDKKAAVFLKELLWFAEAFEKMK